MGMRFGTYTVRSLNTAGSLKTAASKLAKYTSELVAVTQVRWDNGGSQPADNYTLIYCNRNASQHLGQAFFVWKGLDWQLRG
jgi:hypothetical protein